MKKESANIEDVSFHDVDLHHLDDEWVRQPRLYHHYALQLVEAKAEHDRRKAALEVVEAEVARDIRNDPAEYDLAKLTDPIVKNTIPLDGRYQKAYRLLLKAKHDVDVVQAAVNALDHKKRALENLVSLWLADYFSEPRPRKEAREEVGAMERRKVFGRNREKQRQEAHSEEDKG